MRCRSAQANDEAGPQRLYFRHEPRTARSNFLNVRLLMDSALAARFKLEVLHSICDVDLLTVNARTFERHAENTSRGSYKRMAGEVFLVPGLFSHQHQPQALTALSEDSLGPVFP